MKLFRHGDVLIEQIEAMPDGQETLVTELTLALGEATGHHHTVYAERQRKADVCTELSVESVNAAIAAIRYKVKDGIKYFKVESPVELRHQEHDTITLPPGCYRVRDLEREYDPFEKKMNQVRD